MLKALSLAGLVVGAGVLYVVGVAVYNVFLHPLRKYPGPLLWRASRIPFCLSVDGGMIPHEVNRFHKKYGPVVRIAPDQLAYADPQAWKDVMGHHGSKKPEMARWDKYYRSVPGIGTHIINADRADHSAMRKIFSHSFSEKAVRDQEPIIKEYINLFVQRLVENCDDGKATVEMSSYFNYLFFDVIGNLSYGEDFGCLNSDTSVPFVNAFFKGCRHAARLYALAYFPTLQKWELQRAAKDQDAIAEQVGFLREGILKLKKRMDSEEKRPDLIQSLLDNRDKLNLDVMSLETNASILIAAGSETTATTLSGLTYLLLTNRDALDKLTKVIRDRFKTEDEISFSNCADIPYLKACVDEGLRMYPPTPAGLPRVTPPGGAQIAGEWVPEGTAVEFYQYAVGHAPFLWTEADEYHPERWLDDPRFADDQREAFQPFHLGPRSCLGRHLATMELRSIIARLVWKFDMKLDESSRNWMDGQLVYDVWTRPALNVHLTPAKRI